MLALVALVLGVVNAGAHSAATRTVTVQVLGKGTVKSTPGGITCGGGSSKCFAAFSDTADVVLSAKPGGGFAAGTWSGDCGGSTDTECDLGSGSDNIAVAEFNPKSGTSQSTLSVTFADDGVAATGDEGDVSAPEPTPPGSAIDCGNASGGTSCAWVVPTGSTLTVFQTPAAGSVFQGWGGQCSGQAASCTVEMNGDRQVGAAWAPAGGSTAQLSVSVAGSGHVSGGEHRLPEHLRRQRGAQLGRHADGLAERRVRLYRLDGRLHRALRPPAR